MRKTLALAFILCFAATSGFAQSRLNGRWATDRPAEPQLMTDADRRSSTQMEVTILDGNASATIALGGLGGSFHTLKDGKVTGDKVRFQAGPGQRDWIIELVDDNTVMLSMGDLPLVGTNVLDLIAALGSTRVSNPPVQVAAAVPQPAANPSISGIVQDPSRAFIPGVTVTATNADNGAKLTTFTDQAGRYHFFGVTPGRYTMTASVAGFKETTVNNLSLGDAQSVQDFTLEFGAIQREVTPAGCGQRSYSWCRLLHRTK